jgi:hypothetical protein
MPRKLTRKQAEKIIEEQFGDCDPASTFTGLCGCLRPQRFKEEFRKAWGEINTAKYTYVDSYFAEGRSFEERHFLRLLTLHLWVRHDFKD